MGSAIGIIAGEVVAAHEAVMRAAQQKSSKVQKAETPGKLKRVRKRDQAGQFALLFLPEPVVTLIPAVLQMFAALGAGMLLIYFDGGQDITVARAFYSAVITGTTIG